MNADPVCLYLEILGEASLEHLNLELSCVAEAVSQIQKHYPAAVAVEEYLDPSDAAPESLGLNIFRDRFAYQAFRQLDEEFLQDEQETARASSIQSQRVGTLCVRNLVELHEAKTAFASNWQGERPR